MDDKAKISTGPNERRATKAIAGTGPESRTTRGGRRARSFRKRPPTAGAV